MILKNNVIITGGTGFVGRHLANILIGNNFSVSIFSRYSKQNSKDISYFTWDVSKNSINEKAVLAADYIIHLAGENVAEQKWTSKRKAAILSSREQSVRLIYDVLKKHNKKLTAFVSASGVGIYGAINGPEVCVEATQPEDDFLGMTCQKWEAAADAIQSLGIRTVKVRTGLVLGEGDGFLKKLAPLFKYRLGSAIGTGQQYMPWIHVDDLCGIYLHALVNEKMSGAYNAAIADDTTNEIFSKTMAKFYGYRLWLPNVPSFLIQLVLGELSQIILTGRRVSSAKIENTGFKFKYKNLEQALKTCLSK